MRGRAPPQGTANSLSAYARLIAVTTLTEMAGRPGVLRGTGQVDPALARDLATAAASNPRSTWCITVTDQHGHAIGHGCARPEPRSHKKRARPGPSGFTFTPASRDGPPGGHGTWRLRTPGDGPDLTVTFEHNTAYQAGGRSCLCNTGPKCRHDHRLKQHPRWKADQLPDGTFRWTTPAGRSYDTEPTRYPI